MNIPSMKRALAIFLSWFIVAVNSDLGFCINLVGVGKASSVNPHGITKIPADQCTIFSLGTNRLTQFFQVQEPASQDAGIDLVVAETDNGNILDLHPAHASVQPTHLRPESVAENSNFPGNFAPESLPKNLTMADLPARTQRIRHDPAHQESRPGDAEAQPIPMDEADSRIVPIVSYVTPIAQYVTGLLPSASPIGTFLAGNALQDAVAGGTQYIGPGFVSVNPDESVHPQLAARLDRANRAFADTLTKVAHDFMSPATVISGFTDLANTQLSLALALTHRAEDLGLQNEKLDRILGAIVDSIRKTIDSLSQVSRGVDMMLNVRAAVSSLIDLARGRYTPKTRRFDIATMLEEEVANHRRFIEMRNQTIDVRVETPTATHVNADPTTIRRVIDNLLSNATKYSPMDTGWIFVRVFSHPEKQDHVVVSVQDNGIGIGKSDLTRVGEKLGFRTASAEKIQGTGIGFDSGVGLHTVRQILRAHGVDLTVESAGEGLGSTFSFPLPLWVGP